MEGSAYTDQTLELYEKLKAHHPNVGLCLQAYLKRTYTDFERLLPLGPRIRLVKGAYAEPEEIAWQQRNAGRRQLPGAMRVDARRETVRARTFSSAWARTTSS